MSLMTAQSDPLAAARHHHALGNLDEAERLYSEALASNPANAHALHMLSTIAFRRGDARSAIKLARRSLEIVPSVAEAHNNLGSFLFDQGLIDDAIESYRKALQMRPDYPIAYHNLGNALREKGDFEGAEACYLSALRLSSEMAQTRVDLFTLRVLSAGFNCDWSEYEWRWKTGQTLPSAPRAPRWNGESLTGKTMLLRAEQGLGDTLQFIRYAALVKDLGARTIVQCQEPLVMLLATCQGIDSFLADEDHSATLDFQAHLLSLPGILRTTTDTIPRKVPYISADSALTEHWRNSLRDIQGFRVGINWRGRAGKGPMRKRDVPLELLETLSDVAGVRLIALQKEIGHFHDANQHFEPRASVGTVARAPIFQPGEFDTAHGPFMDTAAIMMNLDLVVTSDTSIAHLAGALGVPVWVALPFVPDWRWLLDRTDSPWYPTMRLFRQKSLGDWEGVIEEIKNALATAVHESVAR